MDMGKIVRAKSKFKAEPEGLGIGAAAAALSCRVGSSQNRLDNARADEILYA
ncbi:hypothetical protein [Bradyrhizobium sp. CCBAU 11434]|uniref:hypothetical protein n=1 Tax=Bradyrhizobium sp. CCBAU 11434 TaxID=1630885 RepID=UPI002304E232|nr:hypothetical protein [Bradyrhizobium sp. CCBAU 11434]